MLAGHNGSQSVVCRSQSQASIAINRTPCVANRAQWCYHHWALIHYTTSYAFSCSLFVSVCTVPFYPPCSRSSLLFSQWHWFLASSVKAPRRSALFLSYSALWAGCWHPPMDLQSKSIWWQTQYVFTGWCWGVFFWLWFKKDKTTYYLIFIFDRTLNSDVLIFV